MTKVIRGRRAKTRTRILDSAVDVFSQVGFASASIEMLAEAAGFSRGAFYSNFDSKDELLLAIAEREIELKLDALPNALALVKPKDGETLDSDTIRDVLISLIAGTGDERRWQTLMSEIELFALRNPDAASGFMKIYKEYLDRIPGILVEALARAGLRFTLPAHHAARALTAIYMDASRQAALATDRPFEIELRERMEGFALIVSKFVEPLSKTPM